MLDDVPTLGSSAKRTPTSFALADRLPDSMVGVIMDFAWDSERLHALHLPTEDVPVPELTWHLKLPFWCGPDGRVFAVTPKEVRSRPARHRKHYERTVGADLDAAIHIVEPASRGLRADLSPLAPAIRLDAGRRREAPEGARAPEHPVEAHRGGPGPRHRSVEGCG
jgi:hypothetical protein